VWKPSIASSVRLSWKRLGSLNAKNGPYLVEGGVTLLDTEGNKYELSDTIALCRCGQSSTKAFLRRRA
jgi:hypothetical protein